jgi:hypothetical protein
MTIRPIAFTGAMVSALLDGRKTQTRRVLADVPPAPNKNCHPSHKQIHDAPYIDSYCSKRRTDENPRGMSDRWCWWQVDDRQCPPTFRVPFVPGDLLYVRECWRSEAVYDDDPPRDIPFDACCVQYAADGSWSDYDPMNRAGRLRAAMHMPRWASRLTLRVTNVRVERVKQISEADAKAEGVSSTLKRYPDGGHMGVSARDNFHSLWDSINAPRGFGWDANPWVCCIEFSVHRGNVADLIKSGVLS